MNRREILRYTALISGAAVSLPLASIILSGCKTDEAGQIVDYKPIFFTVEEFAMLPAMVDTILPKTDSPSASEVGVHKMIDSMTKTFPADKIEAHRKGFDALTEYLKKISNGKQFKDLSEDERLVIFKALTASDGGDKQAHDALVELKQQTVAYYLNTEEIATNYLNYDPIPGDYVGCISVSDVNNKKWAL